MEQKNNTHATGHRAAMIVGAALLLLIGLGGGYLISKSMSETDASPAAASVETLAGKASATDHNDADAMFMQMMLPHHAQATEMAKLAETRAGSDDVKQLAKKIEAAQQPEIDKMTATLTAWSESASMNMDDHSGHSMAGMMSASDMDALAGMSGAEFDKTFLTMMTEHHTGAIAMAKDELRTGQNADALALATSIQITQQAEVAEMKALLN